MKTLTYDGELPSAFDVRIIKNMFTFDDNKLPSGAELIALGGQDHTGGKVCYALVFEGINILLDCGRIIGGDESPDHLTTDKRRTSLYPDFSLIDISQTVAIFLSHAHLDHILALPEFIRQRLLIEGEKLDLVVFGTKETISMVKRILQKNQITLSDIKNASVTFQVLKGSQTVECFEVLDYPVYHSTPGSVCFVVKVAGKKILYLPDFKYSRSTPLEASGTSEMLNEIGRDGIDLMMVDATNALIPGFTQSTLVSLANFSEILRKHPDHRIFVAMFGSDIEMVAEMATIANQMYGRPIECDGETMRFFFDQYDLSEQFSVGQPGKLPVVFLTGCQGEPDAALNKIASNDPRANYTLGCLSSEERVADLVIFATDVIPTEGNRRNISTLLSLLANQDCKIISPYDKEYDLHQSGHAGCDELVAATFDVSADMVLPVCAHWESRKVLRLAITTGINEIVAKSTPRLKPEWLPKPIILNEKKSMMI